MYSLISAKNVSHNSKICWTLGINRNLNHLVTNLHLPSLAFVGVCILVLPLTHCLHSLNPQVCRSYTQSVITCLSLLLFYYQAILRTLMWFFWLTSTISAGILIMVEWRSHCACLGAQPTDTCIRQISPKSPYCINGRASVMRYVVRLYERLTHRQQCHKHT